MPTEQASDKEKLLWWIAERICDDEIVTIKRPWWKHGRHHVTDGRMMVTVNSEEPFGAPGEVWRWLDGDWEPNPKTVRRPPNTRSLLAKAVDAVTSGSPIDPPSVRGPGQGWDPLWRRRMPCKLCNGSAEVTCDCGYDHPCSECDKGFQINQMPEAWKAIGYAGFYYQQRYLWTATQLPGAAFYEPVDDGMLIAKYDHGFALIMRTTNPKDSDYDA